jgi:hypothetical protein
MTDPTANEPLDRLVIREIAAGSSDEVDLVARRMQATLVEVEGEANAARLHSLPWIRERLLWHIDNPAVPGRVLVAAPGTGEAVGLFHLDVVDEHAAHPAVRGARLPDHAERLPRSHRDADGQPDPVRFANR